MRTFNQISLALCTMAVAASAMAATYVAADASPESRVCVSAAKDGRMQFRREAKGAYLSLRVISNTLSCNGVNVVSFSQSAGNERTSQLLAHFSKASGQVDVREADAQEGAVIQAPAAQNGAR